MSDGEEARPIQSKADYYKLFPLGTISEQALHHAHEIRKFEIELYWKRATYFWTLIAAAFVGYFTLSASSNANIDHSLSFVVACIGLVLSVGWFQVNRGSKYWQSNWERHVDCLEDGHTGPLYKTTISKKKFRWYSPTSGFPVSVSKTNQVISLYISLVWVVLVIKAFAESVLCVSFYLGGYWAMLICTFVFIGWLLFFCSSKGASGENRHVDFVKCNLRDKS